MKRLLCEDMKWKSFQKKRKNIMFHSWGAGGEEETSAKGNF